MTCSLFLTPYIFYFSIHFSCKTWREVTASAQDRRQIHQFTARLCSLLVQSELTLFSPYSCFLLLLILLTYCLLFRYVFSFQYKSFHENFSDHADCMAPRTNDELLVCRLSKAPEIILPNSVANICSSSTTNGCSWANDHKYFL